MIMETFTSNKIREKIQGDHPSHRSNQNLPNIRIMESFVICNLDSGKVFPWSFTEKKFKKKIIYKIKN